MDINPYRFEAPFAAYEFATFQRKAGVRLVLISTAWLRSEGARDADEDDADEEEEEEGMPSELHLYWSMRLRPLLHTPCIVALCNRTGTERGTAFAGQSCVMSLLEPTVLGKLGADHQGVLVVDAPMP